MLIQAPPKKRAQIKIGVVTALFNREVTEKLEAGAVRALLKNDILDDNILQIQVAGAFEIPLAVKGLLMRPEVDAVVALGAVIRGETAHFDYVCRAVERGCLQMSLEYARPVAFGILTTDNDEQALARAGGSMGNKGEEAAIVALQMLDLMHELKSM